MDAVRTRISIAILLVAVGNLAGASCGGNDLPTEPTPVCTLAISPVDAAYSSTGGTGAVTVTVAAGCAWSATSNADWIVITAGVGNGPGTISYSVDSNSETQPRSGVVSVGGRSHSINQQGRLPSLCSYRLSPDGAAIGDEGGNRTFTVSTDAQCAWTAVSSASWVLVSGTSHGPGSGEVSYTVAPNNDAVERSATITVADRTFMISQVGEAIACQYSVSPVEFSPCMPNGSLTVTLTTQPSCTWTAVPDVSWMNLPGGTSGSGPAVISIRYSDNYDSPRQGTLMVRWPTPTAGQNVRVAQAGCRYAVSRSSFSIAF